MSGCPDCGARSRWRWWLLAAAVLTAAVVVAQLVGCGESTLTVGAVEPSPRIDLPRQSGRLALELGRVPDSFRVSSDSFPTVEVRDFHRTIRAGFERGFGRAFTLARPGQTDRTLVLEVSEIAFVTSATHSGQRAATTDPDAAIVLVHGGPTARHQKAPRRRKYAQLAFRASLREGAVEVAHLSAFAYSEEPAEGTRHGVSRGVESAVAELYEQVARELFLRQTAALEVTAR